MSFAGGKYLLWPMSSKVFFQEVFILYSMSVLEDFFPWLHQVYCKVTQGTDNLSKIRQVSTDTAETSDMYTYSNHPSLMSSRSTVRSPAPRRQFNLCALVGQQLQFTTQRSTAFLHSKLVMVPNSHVCLCTKIYVAPNWPNNLSL